MTRRIVLSGVMCALIGLLTAGAGAEAAKEVTLKGTMTCAKCGLDQAKKCQNALIVTEDGKETTYLLSQNKVSKDYHKNVCSGEKENVTVTGVVSQAEGKKILTASKIEG